MQLHRYSVDGVKEARQRSYIILKKDRSHDCYQEPVTIKLNQGTNQILTENRRETSHLFFNGFATKFDRMLIKVSLCVLLTLLFKLGVPLQILF